MNTHRLTPLRTELSGWKRLASATASACALAGLSVLSLGTAGCIEDTDCGICDPDNLILESISGINYQSEQIHILNPTCDEEANDNCPGPISKGRYFIEEIIPCEDTEEAQASPNAEEYCKLSPLVTAFGIEFVFNNLLDPTSIELVRKRPDDPQLFEVYDWKTDVLQVQGPITRFNGDYSKGEKEAADTISRLVNLSCIDNLADSGQAFGAEDYQDPANNPCNTINPETGLPYKMRVADFDDEGNRVSPSIKAARGIWSANGNSCTSPQEGPDTCCTYCDYLLSTKVDRYGVDPDGAVRNPNLGSAIQCGDAADAEANVLIDKFAACSGFIPSTDRSDEEQSWSYMWWQDPSCPQLGQDNEACALEVGEFKIPLFDKLRETHPDLRPAQLEKTTARCQSTVGDCSGVHGLTGTECIGQHADTGAACWRDAYDDDTTCIEATCRPQWMVSCSFNETTTGSEVAYCQDRRFAEDAVGACHFAETGVGIQDCDTEGGNCILRGRENDNQRAAALAFADWNENGSLEASEACQDSLGPGNAPTSEEGVIQCDPFYQENLFQAERYQRDENLPGPTRACVCPLIGDENLNNRIDGDEEGDEEQTDVNKTLDDYTQRARELDQTECIEAVSSGCYGGDEDYVEGRPGQYAVKFVSRAGGIIYDPAVKGFDWRPADLGGIPRGDIENCAENRSDSLIAPLNRHDGWRAADTFTPENFEDYDRAMCSGQEYTVVFNEPGDGGAYVIDKADNTLAGKSVYTFETPQFHVQPGSGFPTDNLRIGSCDDFSLRFSNKYDSSPENLAKLQLYRVSCTGTGADRECVPTAPDPACDQPNPPASACCETAPVAGGASCYETEAELETQRGAGNACAAPCLIIDVENQFLGEVSVQIDPVEFGQYLERNEVYRMLAPTAGTYDEAVSNPEVYSQVFWDACGMPLVAENAVPYFYDFAIDAPKCKEDADNDTVPLSCDNAPNIFNPDQADIDGDGVGDIVDLCPVAGGDANNTADRDGDGVGNVCDNCRQTLTFYNDNAEGAGIPDYMWVRNIPDQTDTDQDGIGDVCDNCVLTANCEDFGPDNPYEVATPISDDDNDVCQADTSMSMVGNACEGAMVNDFAAGPVGLGDDDDFDQDGLRNAIDGCPRQPLPTEPIACTMATAEEDCGVDVPCTLLDADGNGLCNHIDTDGDGVGNECDTCPSNQNPNQVMDGGAQADDPDGDFVGEVCELGADKGCGNRENGRRFGFYPVAALGNCCTTQLVAADEAAVEAAAAGEEGPLSVGDLLLAATCQQPNEGEPFDLSTCTRLTAPHPDLPNVRDEAGNLILEIPIRTREFCSEADEEASLCRSLPAQLVNAPGILTPPPGCDLALEQANTSALQNLLSPLTDEDFTDRPNPFDALWQNICFLPQVDQDYDGIGDACEKCPFAFDPSDAEYVDANGRLWPNSGAACNGDFKPDTICEFEAMNSGGMETDGDTDDMGGSSSGGMGGSSGG